MSSSDPEENWNVSIFGKEVERPYENWMEYFTRSRNLALKDYCAYQQTQTQLCCHKTNCAATTGKEVLFLGKVITYSPFNLDGTSPENDYSPTPLTNFPDIVKTQLHKQIVICSF